MSVVVLYNGTKKSLKPTPTASVQIFVAEVAAAFGVDATTNQVQLTHKRAVINPSQPWRFANIPNNAQIDLVVQPLRSTTVAKISRLAVTIEGIGSFNVTVPSSSSLLAVLYALVQANLAENAALPQILEVSSTLIYMGKLLFDL